MRIKTLNPPRKTCVKVIIDSITSNMFVLNIPQDSYDGSCTPHLKKGCLPILLNFCGGNIGDLKFAICAKMYL